MIIYKDYIILHLKKFKLLVLIFIKNLKLTT